MRSMIIPTVGTALLTLTAATLGAAPATAQDSYSWTSSGAITDTVAGVSLGNVVFTEEVDTFAAWTLTVGANYQPEVTRFGTNPKTTWPLDTATATPSETRLAMASDGSVGFAVYNKLVSGDRKLYWSRWDGTAWSAPALLASNISSASAPAVDIRDDGSFGVVLWENSSGSVFAARFNGSGFQSADTMASSTSGNVSVAVAEEADRAVASWIRNPGAGARLESRAWNGSTWGALRDVSQNPGGSSTPSGRVDISADGTVSGAIWPVLTGGQWVPRAATGNGDTWNAPQPLHPDTFLTLQGLDLDLSADGTTAFATWAGQTGAGMTVFQNRFAAGAWAGPTILSGPYTDPSLPTPDVAISDDGSRGAITYQNKSSAEFRGRTHIYFGGAWSSFSSLGTANSDIDSGRGQVALSDNGTRGAAVLVQQAGGQQNLQLSQLTVRTAPSAPGTPQPELLTYAGFEGVGVQWEPPAFDGNSPLLGYSVETEPGGPQCSSEGGTSCLVSGMVPGTQYRFRVTARNSYGDSPPSAWSEPIALTAVPAATPPPPEVITPLATVTGITVKMGKRKGPKRKVVIRWSNAAPATSHQVRVKPRGAKWKKWRTTTKPRTALRLKRGKVYRVAVTSTNATGASPVKTKRFRVKR